MATQAYHRGTPAQRVRARIRKEPGPLPTECWIFTGCTVGGYGCIAASPPRRKGKNLKAHRVLWEDANGPIPEGLDCLHKCDVRACCNPEHLFLGTDVENAGDRHAKGRDADTKGTKNGRAKITEEQAKEIRTMYAAGGRTQREIGVEFGINDQMVSRIVAGKAWKHVT